MTESDTGSVLVMDLRTSSVTSDAPGPPVDLTLADRVVLVDRADQSEAHHPSYQEVAAAPQIKAIILVLIGSADRDGGVAVRRPAVLGQVGAILWVDEGQGWLWSGGHSRGRPAASRRPSALDELISTLSLVDVFDAVFARLRELPYQTANPGLDVAHLPVPGGLVAGLCATVLRQLAGIEPVRQAADRNVTTDEFAPEPGGAGAGWSAAANSTISRTRDRATESLGRLARALPGLRAPGGLVDRGRATEIWSRADDAGRHLREHLELVRDTMRRIASHLRTGRPTMGELTDSGLPTPRPADLSALAARLRRTVSGELESGVGLAMLAERLRVGCDRSSTVDSTADHQSGVYADADAAVRRLVPPPDFRLWPKPLAYTLPVVLLTGLAVAWLTGLGLVLAGPIALGWVLAGWLLVARRPTVPRASGAAHRATDPAGVLDELMALGAIAICALIGAVIGTALPQVVTWSAGLTVGVLGAALLVLVATVAISWNLTADTWSRRLATGTAARANQRLVTLLNNEIATTWAHAEWHRRLADARVLLAAGLEDVISVFVETARTSPGNPAGERREPADRAVSEAVRLVLRHDLVELALRVLEPHFTDVEYGAPLSVQPGVLVDAARKQLAEYVEHLATTGVHVPPHGAADRRARRDLESMVWRHSDVGRQQLRKNGRSELTQLCRGGDLRLLTVETATTFRFAPRSVRDLLRDEISDTDVVLTDGAAIGVLRLVSLRAGAIESWLPSTDDEADGLGESDRRW